MDHRDWPLWIQAARSQYARIEKAMAHAAAFPNMEENDRQTYMENLIHEINGTVRKPDEPSVPTAAEEAEWAANRAELLAIFGRKQ